MFKEKEIHNDNVEDQWIKLVNEDVKELILPHSSKFVEFKKCPSCGSTHLIKEFVHQGLNYESCNNCNLLLINPFPPEEIKTNYIINSKALEMWREAITKLSSRKNLYVDRVEYLEKFLNDSFKKNNRKLTILEIGAGNGELIEVLLKNFNHLIENIIVIEPQPLEIKNEKIVYVPGILDDETCKNFIDSCDLVLAFEVLEHILYPNKFLSLINKVLKVNGLFVLSTPNGWSIETQLQTVKSRNIGFDHVRLFNPKSINHLALNNSFKCLDVSTPGKFDVEILSNNLSKYDKSHINNILNKLNANWFNDFLDESLKIDSKKFENIQNLIQKHLMSGHMKCVMQKC
jgi:2-polyprenyl-3-methyl-5-hydroxy-6-metoxy-1,4-benzoquinol methylase